MKGTFEVLMQEDDVASKLYERHGQVGVEIDCKILKIH